MWPPQSSKQILQIQGCTGKPQPKRADKAAAKGKKKKKKAGKKATVNNGDSRRESEAEEEEEASEDDSPRKQNPQQNRFEIARSAIITYGQLSFRDLNSVI